MHPLFGRAHSLSAEVIGAAIEVHRIMGPGLLQPARGFHRGFGGHRVRGTPYSIHRVGSGSGDTILNSPRGFGGHQGSGDTILNSPRGVRGTPYSIHRVGSLGSGDTILNSPRGFAGFGFGGHHGFGGQGSGDTILVRGRVAPGDCSPGAPTDPYVPSRAYGSSRHELASAIRCCSVNTSTNSDASAVFPSNGAMTWRPLLSTGSLRTMVPPLRRYYGTLRLPAVRLDSLRILHEPIPPLRPWFAPLGRGRPTGGQGVVGSGLPIRNYDGNDGASQVPWKPWWSLSVLFDPGRIRQFEWTMS